MSLSVDRRALCRLPQTEQVRELIVEGMCTFARGLSVADAFPLLR